MSTKHESPQSGSANGTSVAHHLSTLLPLPSDARNRYLSHLDEALAAEIRDLLRYQSSAVDLSEQMGQAIARTLLDAEVPPTLGRWQVARPLGQGGMGRVFQVRRSELGVTHEGAAKLGHGALESTTARLSIQHEAAALARLQHGNVARLLDYGESETGRLFVVSEYVDGRQILDHVEDRGLSRRARVALFRQLLDAVSAAHAAPILHLDIKPDNVLVTQGGLLKLIDFGLSGFGGDTPRGYTERYASPEQRRGDGVTVRADIFSLGQVLEDLTANCDEPPSREIAALVARASAPEASDRYASVVEMRLDVDRWLEGYPVSPLASDRLYRWGRGIRRQWRLTAVSILSALLLLAAVVGINLEARRAQAERDVALSLAASERATSSFVTENLRLASAFGGGDVELSVREMLREMVKTLPDAPDLSPRSRAWLASDLAAVLTGTGDEVPALEAAEIAVAAAAASADAEDDIAHWTQLALTAGVFHRYERALEAARQAQTRAEEANHWRLPWTYLARMQTLVAMKQWEAVEMLFPVIAGLKTDRQSVVGNIHYMRGIARSNLGRFLEAEADLDAAAEIYGSLYGEQSAPAVDVDLRRFQSRLAQGRLKEADQLMRPLLTRVREAYGEDHARMARLKADQAWLLALEDPTAGRQSLASALTRLRASTTSPQLAEVEERLARILLARDPADPQILVLLRQALDRLALLPTDHPDTLAARLTRARLAAAQSDTAQFAAEMDKVRGGLAAREGQPHNRLRYELLLAERTGCSGAADRIQALLDEHGRLDRALGTDFSTRWTSVQAACIPPTTSTRR
ncbi:MAG: protein kinase [Pseudomonadota bacterium]